MNEKWRALAADLLDRAAEEFSNHGCNDWDWPDDWTREDIDAFLLKFHAWGDDPSDKRSVIHDFEAMYFLADLLSDVQEQGR